MGLMLQKGVPKIFLGKAKINHIYFCIASFCCCDTLALINEIGLKWKPFYKAVLGSRSWEPGSRETGLFRGSWSFSEKL